MLQNYLYGGGQVCSGVGSRYVEGWWGFAQLNKYSKVAWLLGFLVSWFQNFLASKFLGLISDYLTLLGVRTFILDVLVMLFGII